MADVPVDGLTERGGDPQLRIQALADHDDPLAVSLLTAGIIAREFPELIRHRFSIRVTDRSGSILATAHVNSKAIIEWKEGRISDLEYATLLLKTWKVFGGVSTIRNAR